VTNQCVNLRRTVPKRLSRFKRALTMEVIPPHGFHGRP
jgi:hypothetical protein